MGGSDSKEAKPHWRRDGEAPQCEGCTKPFSFNRRRHHCRSCGGVFCDDCSKRKARDPRYMVAGELGRVCDACFGRLGDKRSAGRNGTAREGTNGGITAGVDAKGDQSRAHGGQALDGPDAPIKASQRIVILDPDPHSTDASGSPGEGLGADAAEFSSSLYEAAANEANSKFIDTAGYAPMTADAQVDTCPRPLEPMLIAALGPFPKRFSESVLQWPSHALSGEAGWMLDNVQKELPPAVVDLHHDVGVYVGLMAPTVEPTET